MYIQQGHNQAETSSVLISVAYEYTQKIRILN